jgi:hypothetical protein
MKLFPELARTVDRESSIVPAGEFVVGVSASVSPKLRPIDNLSTQLLCRRTRLLLRGKIAPPRVLLPAGRSTSDKNVAQLEKDSAVAVERLKTLLHGHFGDSSNRENTRVAQKLVGHVLTELLSSLLDGKSPSLELGFITRAVSNEYLSQFVFHSGLDFFIDVIRTEANAESGRLLLHQHAIDQPLKLAQSEIEHEES